MKTEEKKAQWTLGDQNGHGGISVMEGEDRIATVYLGTISSRWKWGEETFRRPENAEAMKRARLLAAAPDLLKESEENVSVMRRAAKLLSEQGFENMACSLRVQAEMTKTAIAKAKGEETP